MCFSQQFAALAFIVRGNLFAELEADFRIVPGGYLDRKSTRLNSSHLVISYAVFCLKKKFAHTTLSFRPEFAANCMPYVTDYAHLGAQSATVWVRATPLQLSRSYNSAPLVVAGTGHL